MKRLWAFWRIPYVRAFFEREQGCIFCELPSRPDEEALILVRARYCFALMNRFPYNPGHVMVAPFRHVPSLEDLEEEEVLDMFRVTRSLLRAIRESLKPHGFNLGVNVGRVAGAGFEGHVHLHIVPRWNGDTNFMPVIADTKVVSESISDTYSILRRALESLGE
ncbi:MAG: HIT family hydrolase [Thermoproteota archaeon]|nr:MAG: HIT family hydrolase [Candidatus Korarchaeota archaeon]